jgi:hypothetical protein
MAGIQTAIEQRALAHPANEHLVAAIMGLIFMVYSVFGSRFPTNFWKGSTTLNQERINRGFYIMLSAFMFIWGIWHLLIEDRIAIGR